MGFKKIPWPIEDNQFDLIYAENIIEHLLDTCAVMEEIWKVSKPGAIKAKQFTKLNGEHKFLVKPLIASITIANFLIFFTSLDNMNWILDIFRIIFLAGIHLGVLILTKGINKEDWMLAKIFLRR